MNMYGGFSEDKTSYCITERKTPRNWYNYFYNDTYVAFTSQVGVGEGFAQDSMGNRIPLVVNRAMYIADKDRRDWFSASGIPVSAAYDSFRCTHSLASTVTESERNGIFMKYTVFVPLNGNREIWILTIKNLRDEAAHLSAIAYAGTNTDSTYRPQCYNIDVGGFDSASQSAMTRLFTNFGPGEMTTKYGYLITDGKVLGFDTRRNAFIGVYGHVDAPDALIEANGCTNSECVGEKLCFALEAEVSLAPNEEKNVRFEIGIADSVEAVVSLRAHLAPGMPEKELRDVTSRRLSEISGVSIQTPDELFNCAFNGFYKYSTAMGSRWARVRHNGYRDMVSDSECLSAFNPALAWVRFKRALTYQYSNGYAPRTFIDGQLRDNRFSDCAVWITFAAYAIVKELGDLSLLNEQVAFNDGSEASVYEHLLRSVHFLYNFKGQHGLVKIWGGDWNDCMNNVGVQGKGESVWLSIAWYRANRMLMELAARTGREQDEKALAEMGESMKALILRYGWDGKYFLTAIDDNGEKVGSHEEEEGKMFLNPQLWALFAGVADSETLKIAFDEVDSYLDEPLGTVVSKPGYTKLNNRIGPMSQKQAGMQENGGVYLHSMMWKLAAEGMLHRPEKVERIIKQILPWDQTYAPTCGEPYILYNCYFGRQTGYRYATPGQSWRTASTAWFVKAMVQYVFGLTPEIDGLRLRPCLPPSWKTCAIEKQFRDCRYAITYHQTEGKGLIKSITADGEAVTGDMLPYRPGKTVHVTVCVG